MYMYMYAAYKCFADFIMKECNLFLIDIYIYISDLFVVVIFMFKKNYNVN